MPHKILKSMLPTEAHINSFQRLCNNQIDEMRKYDVHMANVKKDPKTFHKYPPPGAHPDIMASIVTEGSDYNISFEIVDDTPVPTLEEKKASLNAQLNAAISGAREAIIPAAKIHLLSIKTSKALAVAEKSRTKGQVSDIAAYQNYNDATSSFSEYAAQCASDIYDLTEKTIDAYKFPPIPKVK